MDSIRNQDIETVKAKVQELLDEEKIKELVRTNSAEFTYEGITYRVRKPKFEEKQKLFKLRCEKQVEMLQATKPDGTFNLDIDFSLSLKK